MFVTTRDPWKWFQSELDLARPIHSSPLLPMAPLCHRTLNPSPFRADSSLQAPAAEAWRCASAVALASGAGWLRAAGGHDFGSLDGALGRGAGGGLLRRLRPSRLDLPAWGPGPRIFDALGGKTDTDKRMMGEEVRMFCALEYNRKRSDK